MGSLVFNSKIVEEKDLKKKKYMNLGLWEKSKDGVDWVRVILNYL